MPKVRSHKTRRGKLGQKYARKQQPAATPVPESPQSLPPAVDAATAPVPSTVEDKPKGKVLPDNSKVRETAIKIVAMRQAGMAPDEIASACNINKSSIRQYVYLATKNGWVTLDDPNDKLEYQIMHKVVRNLDAALDDRVRHVTSGMTVGQQVAVEVAKGTLFKRFDQVGSALPQSTVVAVKIEMPEGPRPQVRDGNEVGGVPAHVVDAEIIHGIRA